MEYNEIKHEIEYINLKNINYDLQKDIILKDYNLKIKDNKIKDLKNEIQTLNKIIKDNIKLLE
tara:strand:- start:2466 stop:2654 length:189 start_codon:yes stop_codon:yes gene_type:complete